MNNTFKAEFTLSLKQHETRRECEWKGYICLVSHTLLLVLSCSARKHVGRLYRVKGHECMALLLKLRLITLSFSSRIFLSSIFYGGKFLKNLLGKLSVVWWHSQCCTCQLCFIALTQECECLHWHVPRFVHNLPKISMSAFYESVSPA